MNTRFGADAMKPRPCVTYARCSTTEQSEHGVSLQYQQERLKQHAALMGLEIVGSFVDSGVSGTKANRPELLKCLDAACKRKLPILTYSISRISRSVRIMAEINQRMEKAGVQLISLSEQIDTSTASGRLTYQIFISLAEHERNLLSERTTSALRHLKAQGKRISGKIPYGQRLVGKDLVAEPKEAAVITLMQEQRQQGKTLKAIADSLKAQGVTTKEGKTEWSEGVISRILSAHAVQEVAA
jgi:DNA invertase Pin-like site-specific DNA recombinase